MMGGMPEPQRCVTLRRRARRSWKRRGAEELGSSARARFCSVRGLRASCGPLRSDKMQVRRMRPV